jgi:kumamolisin
MEIVMAKPFAKSHIRFPTGKIRHPRAGLQYYEPGSMPAAYGMPSSVGGVTKKTIVCFELGGRFYPGDVPLWTSRSGLPFPSISTYMLPGADDSPGDADGEVALDWQKAAEFYSYITGQPANILIVYGPNSGQAFADCINYASTLGDVVAGSWSWGSPENEWAAADLTSLDSAVSAARYPICAASGDNDSGDGESSPSVDCPASRTLVVGCGGTSFPPGGQETVWNNGEGEGTGGGFSKLLPRPAWQPVNSQGSGRMVPDLAMNADPNTGHMVVVNGVWQVIGGTSAVAPMMAGFLGAVTAVGLPLFDSINSLLWANASSFYDVVNGNNGAYSATVGPDPCSGLGRPLATLFAVLTGRAPTSPTPPAPPTPTTVTEATVQAAVDALFTSSWIVTKAEIDRAIQNAFLSPSGKYVVSRR